MQAKLGVMRYILDPARAGSFQTDVVSKLPEAPRHEMKEREFCLGSDNYFFLKSWP